MVYRAEYLNERLRNIDNTSHANVTGHPALTINAGFSDEPPRLPIGMMLIGRRHDDALVLRLARAYERIRDTDAEYAQLEMQLRSMMKSRVK